ncbi:MAG: glycosyltransferase family 1 protein, partial [Oligoflexales bacterium]|nr:glycosyltransferase family 1 protein [Oligoflexales bacterium]
MLRVAFVIQRYGNDFAGGSEAIAREIAEEMKKDWNITVFTTCAKDYRTWKNDYEEGECLVGGVKVVRFRVIRERDFESFSKFSYNPRTISREDAEWFFEQQGPMVPNLIQHLEKVRDEFDVFVFFT